MDNDTIKIFWIHLTFKFTYFGEETNIRDLKLPFLPFINFIFENMGFNNWNIHNNCWLCHYPAKPWYRDWIFSGEVLNFDF